MNEPTLFPDTTAPAFESEGEKWAKQAFANIVRAREERDTAMEQVDSVPEDDHWKTMVTNWVTNLEAGTQFSADDVWAFLGDDGPHDNRALGPVLRRCASNGLTFNTKTYTPSVRRHMTPIVVWERR